MVLLVGLLCTSLAIGICASAVADDFLPDPVAEDSQFVLPEIDGPGSALALALELEPEPASIPPDNLDLDWLAQMVSVGSLSSTGENSALDFFSPTNPSGEIFTEDASNTQLIAAPEAGCVSYEGQALARIRRGNFCVDDSSLDAPSTGGSDTTFPPAGSNPNRIPGSIHDPKPRPTGGATDIPNTKEDFALCGSGVNGYRLYAVCDSGRDQDRRPGSTYHDWSLTHCSRCRDISSSSLLWHERLMMVIVLNPILECYPPHKRWCCTFYADYVTLGGFGAFCEEILLNPFYP